jgi:hypothetical protein
MSVYDPICVFCHQATTPSRLVEGYFDPDSRRYFTAHRKCNRKNKDNPIPRSRANEQLKPPGLDDSLAEWNTLVDELKVAVAQMATTPHAKATLDVAWKARNAAHSAKQDMTWALAGPRSLPRLAADQVRLLGWHVARLKTAFESDPARTGERDTVNFDIYFPSNPRLSDWEPRLPDLVEEVRQRYGGRYPRRAARRAKTAARGKATAV